VRPARDDTGIELASVWAERGTCARRRVGCVLFDADGYQLASGYNGPHAGAAHCTEHPCRGAGLPSGTGLDECEALHAEWNALARCADVRAIHTCYVTASPCVTCVKMLLGTGCRRIVFVEEYPHLEAKTRWLQAGREWVQTTRRQRADQP
jgi:dCMP deaminase